MQNPTFAPFVLTLIGLACAAGTTFAVTVISDDFDTGSSSTGWDANTSTTVIAPGAQSSSNAVSLAATSGALGESFIAAVPGGAEDFILDYYFRVQTTANRQFSLLVSAAANAPSTTQASLNLRYQGGWGVFNTTSNAFVAVSGLSTVTAGSWYHMQVEGVDWGLPTASYTLRLSDAGGSAFTSSAAGLTSIQNGAFVPITTNTAKSFLFNTAFGTNPGFDLDNITVTGTAPVPEASSAFLTAAGFLLLSRRRRA